MPDWLSHVLIAYVLCQLLHHRYDWLSPTYVTVAMVGALLPDISKLNLLFSSRLIRQALDVPFSLTGVHSTGGVIIASLIGGVLTNAENRWRVVSLLLLGGMSHLVADVFLRTPTGNSYAMFWPFSSYLPPTPGLYLSTDPGPTVLMLGIAIVLTMLRRRDGEDRE